MTYHRFRGPQADAQAANGRLDEIRQAADKQLAKLQTELDQARAGQIASEKRVADAEKHAVDAEAHLGVERAARKTLEAQAQDLSTAVKRQEGEASRASSAEAVSAGHRDQVALLNDTVSILRGLLNQAAPARTKS